MLDYRARGPQVSLYILGAQIRRVNSSPRFPEKSGKKTKYTRMTKGEKAEEMKIKLTPIYKTLPKSSIFVTWVSVRFYETDCTIYVY